jgi:NAD(P)-dependent dehydrogenase (short-subunit alcohol dehydrogenase family)
VKIEVADNSGIGLATATLFREHGAKVAVLGPDPAALEAARHTIGADTLAVCCWTPRSAEVWTGDGDHDVGLARGVFRVSSAARRR